MTTAAWQLIVPVKPPAVAKSRLDGGEALARAIAHDTVSAAAAADRVARVVVVTADLAQAAELVGVAKVDVVLEDHPAGIAAAITVGLDDIDRLGAAGPRGVLLGDLPALAAADLDAALAAATDAPRCFVRDAEGTGTSLVTAAEGVDFLARFGPDSARLHVEAGLTELAIEPSSTLRLDVDTAADLDAARTVGLGPATRSLLA